MTQIRTDLALEAAENLQAGGPAAGKLSGVVTRTERRQGVSVTEVRILDETGARALGKPVGRYVTMELESQPFSQQAACLASLLAELLPRGPVLTAGIGNRDMTCDAIGPTAVEHLLVTRHLVRSGQEPFRGMGELSALCTEVLGRTGMETCELIRAAAGAVRPAAVVAVDALAARSPRRLCRTVQLSDTGLIPGSGVGKPPHRRGPRDGGGAGHRRGRAYGHRRGGAGQRHRSGTAGAVCDPQRHRPAGPTTGAAAGLRHLAGGAAGADGGGAGGAGGIGGVAMGRRLWHNGKKRKGDAYGNHKALL